MKCKICGHQNEKDCKYCIDCGNILKKGFKEKLDDFTYLNTRTSRIIFFALLGIFVFSVAFISKNIATRDIRAFVESYRSGNVHQTKEIYNNHKENSRFEATVTQFFYSEADRIEQNFLKGNISKEEAVGQFNNMLQYDFLGGSIGKTRERIIKIDASRICFKNGTEKLKNNEYVDGIEFLENVAKEDSNYNEARKLIKDNKKNFKDELISRAKKCYEERDYKGAINWVNKGYRYFPMDRDFEKYYILSNGELKKNDKKSEKELQDYKALVEKLKQEQLMLIESIGINKEDKNFLEAVWKNNSQKTIKSYSFGVYTFKENGQPTCYGDNYFYINNKDKMKVKPGENIGKEDYWEMPDGTEKVKVCIDSIVFEDGTTWENKYNLYWYYDEADKF